MFVTDYDGTLFTNEKDIKITIKKLKKLKEKDFVIVIATGRSYSSIKNQTVIYNIPYDYLVCADGSIIYNNDEKIIKKYPMKSDIIKPFEKFYQTLNYEEIQFSYPNYYSNLLCEDKDLLGINICISNEYYIKEIVDEFIEMSKHYPNYNFLNYMHHNYSYLCVKPKGISKSASIKYLMKKHKLSKENIYVIGDSTNDYEMIKDFNGYCINNSFPEILEIAKKKYPNINIFINELLKED